MPRLISEEIDRYIDDPNPNHDTDRRFATRRREHRPGSASALRSRTRPHERNPFKCGRCRAFVGPTVFGGRHRNHCPFCLTSRHVDAKRPGDRSSTCRALMAPVGTTFRLDGEQMVAHRCNGCGIERQNRVAADDDAVALMRLPVVATGRAMLEADLGEAEGEVA